MRADAVTETMVRVRVSRCVCGEPESHAGQPCPTGEWVDLGLLDYWHRSPLVRLAYRIAKRFDLPWKGHEHYHKEK